MLSMLRIHAHNLLFAHEISCNRSTIEKEIEVQRGTRALLMDVIGVKDVAFHRRIKLIPSFEDFWCQIFLQMNHHHYYNQNESLLCDVFFFWFVHLMHSFRIQRRNNNERASASFINLSH